jgi:glycosyltransferase involved in cell wall biosynthesis
MTAVPDASVVIPAHDAAATIGRTLEALRRQDLDGEFEVIVVDDGSADGTPEVAEASELDVRVIRQERRGAAAARNLGAAAARSEAIAFTDADCFPEPGWLRVGLNCLEGADLVQGAVRPDPGAVRHPIDRTLWVDRESGLYETANLFVRRDPFAEQGGFQGVVATGEGRPMGEDVWLGWRLRRAGARSRFCPDALVHHAVFESSAGETIAETARLRHFPPLVARIPELREELLYRRLFLSRHTALFDLAVVGCAAGLAARRVLPLAAAAPYAWRVARPAVGWRRHAPKVVVTRVLADSVGLAALLVGGVRARSPVL